MIGGYAIGAQPVGAFRRVLASGGLVASAITTITIASTAAGALSANGAAAISLALAASTTATLTTGGTASAAPAITAESIGALRTGALATALFTITASAAATIAGGTIIYTPSTARQLSAADDRLLFGGGVRSLQGG